jgi:hypothetical protein
MPTHRALTLQPVLTIVENPFHVAPHKKLVDQGPAPRTISDMVQAEGAAVAFLKGMGVMLQRVGPLCWVKLKITL